MNILLDTLPITALVNDTEYPIDADYRTMIAFEKILLDKALDNRLKIMRAVELVFIAGVPEDIAAALDEILFIYRCGQPIEEKKPSKNGQVELRPKMIYDYAFDAPYIYGAFLSQYGVDLQSITFLHWWKFQAMFRSLNSSNKIVEIMGYRAADLSKIENAEERQRIQRLQTIYALPQSYTTEEKVAMAGAAFGGMIF